MVDIGKPRLFLWELVSYANEWGKLGILDDKGYPHQDPYSVTPDSKWAIWTRHDRREGMPTGVAPERFYLETELKSHKPLGDYTSWGERVLQVVSNRFAKLLEEMGQTDYQLFPLTMWWPPHGDKAPPPDRGEVFQALYCWKNAEVFDLQRSTLSTTNLVKHNPNFHRSEFDAPEDEVPTTYNFDWKRLALGQGGKPDLPPMYRIPRVGLGRYVSPQMKDEIERRKLKVKFARRYLDYEYEAQLTEAYHAARRAAAESNTVFRFDHPEEVPLGY